MEISSKTKINLAQLLSNIDNPFLSSLLAENDIYESTNSLNELRPTIEDALEENIDNLIFSIIAKEKSIRNRISPRYLFDESYRIFCRSLSLDGFNIQNGHISSIDPEHTNIIQIHNELLNLLDNTQINEDGEITRLLEQSSEDFINEPPNYNGSLNNTRVSLETIIRRIAVALGHIEPTGSRQWGTAVNFLKNNNTIDQDDENAITSVYTLISDGSHIPVGFTEEAFAGYARNLCVSISYYVLKKYNR